MERILIAPWGLPVGWKEVSYLIGEKEERATSSIKPLVNELKPNKVILVVVDTAIQEKFGDYQDLCKKVEEFYRKYCEEALLLPLAPEVVVAPGVGTFFPQGEKIRFEGEMTDFYYFVSFELAKRLISVEGELDLILDLTHGVNFAPTLLYRGLHEILGVLAYTKKVLFRVFNAEPFREGVEALRIHPVESREIQPRLSPHLLGEKDGRAYLLKPGSDGRIEKEETDELNAFLSSIVNGLPLAFFTFYPKEGLEKRLKKACSLWREAIECGRSRVVRRRRFTEDFMRCIRLWVAAKSFGKERKEEVSLEELEDVAERFRTEGMKYALIGRTLKDLKVEEDKRKKLGEGWVPLSEVMERKAGPFSPQNFLAHAGLEYNLTEVCVSDGTIKLRYPKSQRKNVREACRWGLFNPGRK